MVASRLERKRAYDREAQRANRAKTKAYIRHLEEAVETLTKTRSATAPINAYTIQQQAKISNLEAIVGQIRAIVHNADEGILPTSESLSLNRSGKSTFPISHYGSSFHKSLNVLNSHDCTDAPPPCTQQDLRLWAGLGQARLQQPGEFNNFFMILSNAIEELERNCISEPLSDPIEDEDILARILVFGWETVVAHRSLDRVWHFLRTIDEGLYRQAEPIEKLVNLQVMRCMLVHKIRPSNQCRRSVPSFMAQTRLQQTSAYPPLIDYFVWPSVRNYMVYHGNPYMSVTTAAKFATHVRFKWTYQLRDVYMINNMTGRYKLSSAWLDAFNDIRSYDLRPFDEQTPVMPSTTAISMPKIPEDFPFDLFSQIWQVNFGSLSDPGNQIPEGTSGVLAEAQDSTKTERSSAMFNQFRVGNSRSQDRY